MSGIIFAFPQNAYFGRNIPKSKIYEKADVKAKIKDEFVAKIEAIIYAYELSPKSLNLKATPDVPKIEIIHINLRADDITNDALEVIDRSIPRPTIFELIYAGKIKQICAYKRPSDVGGDKWVMGNYFETDWHAIDAPRAPLPQSFDLGALYLQMLQNYIGQIPKKNEAMPEFVVRLGNIAKTEKEIARLGALAQKQKSANKQFEINAQIRALKNELQSFK